MKKIILSILILFLAINIQTTTAQDNLKEGKVTFEISYPESEEMNDQMLAMMPKDMTTWFKNGKSRTELKMAFSNTVTIYDPVTKESVTCMDMMGKKNAVKTTMEDSEKEKEKSMGDYEVKLTDDTKKIAGYKAKKAIVTFKDEHEPMDVWYTDELSAEGSGRNAWKGINGFPLEYGFEQKTGMGSMKMQITCTKIEKIAVSDDLFKIPEGYSLTSRDELMQQYKEKSKESKTKGEAKESGE